MKIKTVSAEPFEKNQMENLATVGWKSKNITIPTYITERNGIAVVLYILLFSMQL